VDPIERIDRATAYAGGNVGGVRPDDLGKPTPCTEFDVRTLLNHMIGYVGMAASALERDWELPFGTLAGSMMATILFMEHLTHGWDVAKATGQDTTMPGDLVAECMELVRPMDEMLRMPGVCGPAVNVPESASPQDKFIAFMGRTP
jgi:hypothetical protein